MSDPEFEDVPGVEADTADVIEQAESAGGEPVDDALRSRERIPVEDAPLDERIARDADEAAGGAGV
ncbi:hypothetical protein [Amnibacterium endophyticum]|uniref:Multidrug transporter n=1 Tax=Amnibacterium endophyticum TaxID=2109337 RepID=A0ABW4LI29_9MICO